MEYVILWFIMAVICGMVAASKKGAGIGFLFFLYGLILWPIALVHALLIRAHVEPVRAEGVIGGKPYWRAKGEFCTVIDGKEVSFATMEMLSAALSGGEYQNAQQSEDELIGQRLLRRVKEL